MKKCRYSFILSLALSLFGLTSIAQPESFTLGGCGNAALNGTYTDQGDVANGCPIYVHSNNSLYIWRFGFDFFGIELIFWFSGDFDAVGGFGTPVTWLITNDNCDPTDDPPVPGPAGEFGGCGILGALPLPVELLSFSAKNINGEVLLKWQTASELENEGFEIQKSADGRNWKILDFIPGNGTTTALNHYSYIDRTPFSGVNYYRLRQIDFDGKYEYSDMVTIGNQRAQQAFHIFPNPTFGAVNMSVYGEKQENSRLRLIDNLGKVVLEEAILVERGENTFRFNWEQLPGGLYFAQVRMEGQVLQQSFFLKK